jgi:hypothetical protein
MITAHGTLTFSTRTTPAELLRSLVELVDDLQFAGINVEVTVTVGDDPATQRGTVVYPAPANKAILIVPSTQPPDVYTNGASPISPPIALNWDSPELWKELWYMVEDLNKGAATFRSLGAPARYDLAGAIMRNIEDCVSGPMTLALFDQHKPAWCPIGAGLTKTFGLPWSELRIRWRERQPFYPDQTAEADDDTAPFRIA